MTIAAVLVAAATAALAADLAEHRSDGAGHVGANPAPSTGRNAEHGDRAARLASSTRFRTAEPFDPIATHSARWRLPDAFGYHPSALDSAELAPAPTGDSSASDDALSREGWGAQRRRF